MSRPKRKPAALVPSPTTERVYQSDALGDVDMGFDYRLEGAPTETMLVRLLSPWDEPECVTHGLRLAADQLMILRTAMQANDVTINRDIVTHVLSGLEERVRVLSELARRLSESRPLVAR